MQVQTGVLVNFTTFTPILLCHYYFVQSKRCDAVIGMAFVIHRVSHAKDDRHSFSFKTS